MEIRLGKAVARRDDHQASRMGQERFHLLGAHGVIKAALRKNLASVMDRVNDDRARGGALVGLALDVRLRQATDNRRHSARSAVVGSTRAARRAGR